MYRTAGSIACYVSEMAGAVALFAGSAAGLYVVAVAMVANFFFMISGSWLLLVGVTEDEALQQAQEPARVGAQPPTSDSSRSSYRQGGAWPVRWTPPTQRSMPIHRTWSSRPASLQLTL